MINVYKYLNHTNVEGPGVRFCLWVQGCKKHCVGCYASETWSFEVNKLFSPEEIFSMIPSDVEGITFLGGEPFEQAKDLTVLAQMCKEKNLSVVCFTGYALEEIQNGNDVNKKNLLNSIDLLIDGAYEEDKYDLSRPWVGSSNQRYIFLTDRYSKEDILKYRNKVEMRISKDGKLEINGMGDFKSIERKFCLQLGKNNVELLKSEREQKYGQ